MPHFNLGLLSSSVRTSIRPIEKYTDTVGDFRSFAPTNRSKAPTASSCLGLSMAHSSGKPPLEQVLPAPAENESSSASSPVHGAPELIGMKGASVAQTSRADVEEIDESKKGWFAYFRTRNFYIVLILGYAARTPMRFRPLTVTADKS